MEYATRWSVWLDVCELDHLGPLLGFLNKKPSEFGRRHRQWHTPKIGEPRLQRRIGEARIDLLVELGNNFSRRVLGRADALPTARLESRQELADGRDVWQRRQLDLQIRWPRSVANGWNYFATPPLVFHV
jgi:hypothetical protein